LPAVRLRQPPGRPASACRSSGCLTCHRLFYSGLVVGNGCATTSRRNDPLSVRNSAWRATYSVRVCASTP
jgi:hypothetical protein